MGDPMPGEAHCSTCRTTTGLRRFERVTGGGWTCIPCVRKAQGLSPLESVRAAEANSALDFDESSTR